MTTRCRHPSCKRTFTRDVTHRAFLRIAAERAGWGCSVQVHTKTFRMRYLYFCPDHLPPAPEPKPGRPVLKVLRGGLA